MPLTPCTWRGIALKKSHCDCVWNQFFLRICSLNVYKRMKKRPFKKFVSVKIKVGEPVSGKEVLLELGKHSLERIDQSPGTWPEGSEALGIRERTRRLDKKVWVTGRQHHGRTDRAGPCVALNLKRQCFCISKAFCLFFVFLFLPEGDWENISQSPAVGL